MTVLGGGRTTAPLRVLIVEDDWLLALDLKHVLEPRGHKVVGMAADTAEALAAALRTSPDLAFVDVNLRDGRTGTSISAAIRKQARTAVIFVTANPEDIPADFAGALGAIKKPWKPEVIEEVLHFVNRYRTDPLTPPPQQMIVSPSMRDRSRRERATAA